MHKMYTTVNQTESDKQEHNIYNQVA